MPSAIRTDRAHKKSITKYPVMKDTNSPSKGWTMPVMIRIAAKAMGVLSVMLFAELVPASASVSSCADAARRKMRPRVRDTYFR